MKITLKKSSYKGTDGSSLSESRCKQFVTLYNFCQQLGDVMIDYDKLQKKAVEAKLYGETQADKAIRTFAPLLSKLGFVNYEGQFQANKLFTDNGIMLIQTVQALELAKSTGNQALIKSLNYAKQDIQRLGLHNMFLNPEWQKHNIWIAIAVLQELGDIFWEDFGFLVYQVKEQGKSVKDAISALELEHDKETIFEYFKEDGTKMSNTFYSYIHAFLVEAGIARDTDAVGYSKICDEAEDFLELINIDGNGTF